MPELNGGIFGLETEGNSEYIATLKEFLRGINKDFMGRFIQTIEEFTV